VFVGDGCETGHQMLHIRRVGSDNIQQPTGDGEKQDRYQCTAVHTDDSYVPINGMRKLT
jgi:hypothetical protein